VDKRRRQIAAQYREGIAHASLECLAAPSESEGVYHLFPILVKNGKAEFLAYMRQKGILCGEHYPIAIPDQAAMAHGEWEAATGLEEARRIAKSEVSLPIHPYLSDAEVELVMGACREWRVDRDTAARR